MGVEEIRRINALARELMRHGIAQTSDEAMVRAGEMLRANGVNSMTAAITSHSPIGKSGEEAIITNEALSDINMDIRSLGVRFEAVVREVITLKDEIKKLGGSLSDTNSQITRLSAQQDLFSEKPKSAAADWAQSSQGLGGLSKTEQHVAAEAAQAAPAGVQQTFAREAVQPIPQFEKPKAAAAKPREEQYKPEDVAIEKIFYFGK